MGGQWRLYRVGVWAYSLFLSSPIPYQGIGLSIYDNHFSDDQSDPLAINSVFTPAHVGAFLIHIGQRFGEISGVPHASDDSRETDQR